MTPLTGAAIHVKKFPAGGGFSPLVAGEPAKSTLRKAFEVAAVKANHAAEILGRPAPWPDLP